MGFLSVRVALSILVGGVGWLCLLGWLAVLVGGGGKNVLDYARRSIAIPLAQGQPLAASDQQRAMWSGWWSVDAGGYRLSTSRSPDILFRWDRPASSCALDVRAFPMRAAGQVSQPLYAKVNDAPLAGPVEIAADGTFRIDHVGAMREGINVLTFWLPGARRMNERDERYLALALRSVEFVCDGHGPP